jgi:anti-anti-sigma regulatory factor
MTFLRAVGIRVALRTPAVRRLNRLTSHIVIRLPRQVDAGNAEEIALQLRAAYAEDKIIIADMAKTLFCDSRGTQELLSAHYWARALRCELRVAGPCLEVLRGWQLLGVNEVFAIYPSLEAARQ